MTIRSRPWRFRGYADDSSGDVTVYAKPVDAGEDAWIRLGAVERQHVNGTAAAEIARMLEVDQPTSTELGWLSIELHWPRRW